jgi:hypothetical protein
MQSRLIDLKCVDALTVDAVVLLSNSFCLSLGTISSSSMSSLCKKAIVGLIIEVKKFCALHFKKFHQKCAKFGAITMQIDITLLYCINLICLTV